MCVCVCVGGGGGGKEEGKGEVVGGGWRLGRGHINVPNHMRK